MRHSSLSSSRWRALTAAPSERHLLSGASYLALSLAACAFVCFLVTEVNLLLWPD